MDTIYKFINSTFLLGYKTTKMQFVEQRQRWEIINIRFEKTLAFFNETKVLPIGKQKWFFDESIGCSEKDKTFRFLNLHLKVEQPGHFCCNDGRCIDSKLVCNDIKNCKDGEDEECDLFINSGRETDFAPFDVITKTNERIDVKILATITILDVFRNLVRI